MARVELAEQVSADIERILDYMIGQKIPGAASRIEELMHAISVLEHSPLIGRPGKGDKRELVIGKRTQGYVALYRYVAEIDMVFVLSVRSQREAGFSR